MKKLSRRSLELAGLLTMSMFITASVYADNAGLDTPPGVNTLPISVAGTTGLTLSAPTPTTPVTVTANGLFTVNQGWSPAQALSINSNQVWKSATAGDSTLYLQYSNPGGAVTIGGSPGASNNLNVLGAVGVGTTAPTATLDVHGEIRPGNTGAACNTTNAGAIRWTGTVFQGCTGAQWMNLLSGSVSVGGIDQVSEDNTGIFGYCRFAWGAATDCNAKGAVCQMGTPTATAASHDNIGSDEDMSPKKFISAGPNGANIIHYDCITN